MWRSPWASRLAKIAVSGVLIATVIWQVGPNAVVPERLRPEYLLAGVGLFIASNLLGAYQWNLLLRSAEIRLSRWIVTRAYFTALFFNSFLIGGIGGDVLRALDLRRNSEEGSHGRTAAGVATIVMDRFLGFFTMMWYAGVAAWLSRQHSEAAAPIASILATFVVLAVLLTSKRLGTRFDGVAMRILPDRVAQPVVNLRTGFVAMRRRYRVFLLATFVSVLVQGLRILVHFMCAQAVGVDAPLVYYFIFIPLVGVAAAMPISVGGLGTREWAAVGLFATIGVGGAGVVAMELLAHATALVSSLPGAFAFILRGSETRTEAPAPKEPEVREA